MNHIVALSGGKDSTALAVRLAEVEPREYTYVCTPTGDELPEMVDHWLRLEDRLRQPIVRLRRAGASLPSLIYVQRALPNWRMRWCTRLLKIEPFEEYLLTVQPCTVYVGIRADEADREGAQYASDGIARRFPLVEWGWNKGDVLGYLAEQGIVIPDRTDCGACFFQTLYEWWTLWQTHPDRYARYEEWERFTGHTLRSEQRDTWPAALCELRKRFEAGDVPKRRKMSERSMMCSVCAR